MTTDDTPDLRPSEPIPGTRPPGGIRPSALPYGIAPVAAGAPPRGRRGRRRRLVDAAIVSSTLAALPVAATLTRTDSADRTLVEAVSQLEAADDESSVRAVTAALKAGAPRRTGVPATAPVAGPTPTVAGPARTDAPTAGDAPAPAGATAPAPAPVPAGTDASSLSSTPAGVDEGPVSPLVAAADEATATRPTPIARAAGVELVAPSDATVLVGFHEAAAPGTEPLESMAPLALALNGAATAVAPDAGTEQLAPVMELPTRDRPQPAASAVDVAVPAWRDIVAPVTGRVVSAAPYVLYGEFADNRVEIEPEGHPGVRVVMIHIGEVQVRPGDEVVAGETVVARTAKQFPFASQIDRFAAEVSGEPRPHVHMEVRRVG